MGRLGPTLIEILTWLGVPRSALGERRNGLNARLRGAKLGLLSFAQRKINRLRVINFGWQSRLTTSVKWVSRDHVGEIARPGGDGQRPVAGGRNHWNLWTQKRPLGWGG